MDRYGSDDAKVNMTTTDVYNVLATIAQEEGMFNDSTTTSFTREYFLTNIGNRDTVGMPTWFEHKKALAVGVFKAPQHVINGKLLVASDSTWNVSQYETALQSHVD